MKPTPLPVAVRAYTVRTESRPAKSSPKRLFSRRTLTVPIRRRFGAGQSTTSCSTRKRHAMTCNDSPSVAIVCFVGTSWADSISLRGLFHPEESCGLRCPAGFAELKEYGRARGIDLLSRRAFVEQVFRRVAIELRGLVVGFNPAFDFARLAIESGEARNSAFYGGFSFVFWEYEERSPASGEKTRTVLACA